MQSVVAMVLCGPILRGRRVLGSWAVSGFNAISDAAFWLEQKAEAHVSEILSAVSTVANVTALIAGNLDFIPGVGEIALAVSVTASVVAMAADTTQCVVPHGDCNYAAIALDVVAMIPEMGIEKATDVAKDARSTLEDIRVNSAGRLIRSSTGRFIKDLLPKELTETLNKAVFWGSAATVTKTYLDAAQLAKETCQG